MQLIVDSVYGLGGEEGMMVQLALQNNGKVYSISTPTWGYSPNTRFNWSTTVEPTSTTELSIAVVLKDQPDKVLCSFSVTGGNGLDGIKAGKWKISGIYPTLHNITGKNADKPHALPPLMRIRIIDPQEQNDDEAASQESSSGWMMAGARGVSAASG